MFEVYEMVMEKLQIKYITIIQIKSFFFLKKLKSFFRLYAVKLLNNQDYSLGSSS